MAEKRVAGENLKSRFKELQKKEQLGMFEARYKDFWDQLTLVDVDFELDDDSTRLLRKIGVPNYHRTFEFEVSVFKMFSETHGNHFIEFGRSPMSSLCVDSRNHHVVRIRKKFNPQNRTMNHFCSSASYICKNIYSYFMCITIIEMSEKIIYSSRENHELLVSEEKASKITEEAKSMALSIDPTLGKAWENIWMLRLSY